jgi:hypothetical protein
MGKDAERTLILVDALGFEAITHEYLVHAMMSRAGQLGSGHRRFR